VVQLAGDEQQRPPLRVVGVDFGLGPGVQVGRGRLEQRFARTGHGELLIQVLGLVLVDGIGEAVAELLIGQRHRPIAVGRVVEHREAGLEGRDRQGQDPAEGGRVDGHRHLGQATAGQDLGQQPSKGMPDDRRLGVQAADDGGEVVGDLPDRLAREHLRVLGGLDDGVGVVGPAGVRAT
jgi:hypothetical protein